MSSNVSPNADTLVGGDVTTDTHQSVAGDVIPGLFNDIVVTHILRSEYFEIPQILHDSQW